ncbi:hypothetical protein CAPTEDRAFT_185962 [Capitella teleta]|uniref:Uncharacterized protein n=1 Tax=Capitella teleta TaxID=283909 RepID=R7VKX5_CAPTE|nr:hypothetical protein CAPTEDRAFT_185962 [Capitella teleta]|eukprot:ELU17756.1 hypothetical protein CAPTEDRAFT_185962 [Capitella teleta]
MKFLLFSAFLAVIAFCTLEANASAIYDNLEDVQLDIEERCSGGSCTNTTEAPATTAKPTTTPTTPTTPTTAPESPIEDDIIDLIAEWAKSNIDYGAKLAKMVVKSPKALYNVLGRFF